MNDSGEEKWNDMVMTKCKMLVLQQFFFFKKIQWFITRGAEADRGKYMVPT